MGINISVFAAALPPDIIYKNQSQNKRTLLYIEYI